MVSMDRLFRQLVSGALTTVAQGSELQAKLPTASGIHQHYTSKAELTEIKRAAPLQMGPRRLATPCLHLPPNQVCRT